MAEKLYLIVAEHGSYSDYICWIAYGCFSEEEASAVADDLNDKAAAWDKWRSRYVESLKRIRSDAGEAGLTCTDEHRAAARAAAGPEPELDSADRYSVVEVPVGKVGTYEW